MFFDLSPAEVEKRINTESGCLSLLFRSHFPHGKFRCPSCGGTKSWSLNSRNHTIECVCGKQFSLTANNFFHQARIPLSKLFRLLYDVGSGVIKSAGAFARELNISHSSAWRWLQKVSIVVDSCRLIEKTGQIPRETVERVIFKRSDQSLPKPLADGQPDRSLLSKPTSSGPKPFVVRLEHGLEKTETHELIVAAFSMFISTAFQGISAKYAQRYAHHFSFIAKPNPLRFQSLLIGCVNSTPITTNEITNYLSPPVLAVDAFV
jgi:transposase-like protein